MHLNLAPADDQHKQSNISKGFSTDPSLFVWRPHLHPHTQSLWNCCCAAVTYTEESEVVSSAVHRKMEGPLARSCSSSVWSMEKSAEAGDEGGPGVAVCSCSTGFCPSTNWWQTITDKASYSLGITFMWQRCSFNNYLGGSLCTQRSGIGPTTAALLSHSPVQRSSKNSPPGNLRFRYM